MKLGAPIHIADGVYQVRTIGARVTVVTAGEQAAMVDAGARGSLGAIAGGLSALGWSLERVALIAVTHYHPDHGGGLARLAQATSAKVAVHRNEAEIVSGRKATPSPFRNGFVSGVTRPFVARLYGGPVGVDCQLEDGDRLPFAEEMRVIHTPGHTPGSICLYLPSKKVLIVGDALQHRFRRLQPPAEQVTQNSELAMESLEKLVSLDFDTLCFGHFPPLRRDARDALRRLVERNSPVNRVN